MKSFTALPTYKSLSPAEKIVLILSAQDLKGKALTERLGRSKHTPKNHLCNIKKKLKVKTIPGALTRAHQLGEIDLDTIKIE
jgi:DNA-binding CsgD family transcriptional regulator